jgi:hypothetical protein
MSIRATLFLAALPLNMTMITLILIPFWVYLVAYDAVQGSSKSYAMLSVDLHV